MHEPAMNASRGNVHAEVSHITHKVIAEYRRIGGLAFSYGQGSVFAGFSQDADLDINLVWERACPPPREVRPVGLLCDSGHEPVQFDEASLALDKLWVDDRQVDVVHHSRKTFDWWLEQVRRGDGWQESVWPLPLFAVSAFFYGVLLDDAHGDGALAHAALALFPDALIHKTHETLTRNFSFYQDELAACVHRGDGWLFHELLGKLLRDAYITWFAAEHRYCPHMKRLQRWIERFNMDAEIAGIERSIWEVPNLASKLQLVTMMLEKVLQMKKTSLEC
jgi:hypothetical protein